MKREDACQRQAFKPKETRVFEVEGGLPKADLQTKRDTHFGEKRWFQVVFGSISIAHKKI